MARKVILSAGHGGDDPGASGNGYIERDLAIELRNLVAAELRLLGVPCELDHDRNALAATMQWIKGKFTAKDILVDIHWNAAGNPEAKGSEVIVPEKASAFELNLAADLLKVFTGFGFKDRGVRSEALTARKSLAWMKPQAETVLIEVCFISNGNDMKLYLANKNGIARGLARVLKAKSND